MSLIMEQVGDRLHIHDNREGSIIVTDMDEILVNISPKWLSLIQENYHLFKDYFKNP